MVLTVLFWVVALLLVIAVFANPKIGWIPAMGLVVVEIVILGLRVFGVPS